MFLLQFLDVSYNSLSGWVPNSLLGISEPGPPPDSAPFPDLSTIHIFHQWGSRVCAHVRSSDDFRAVPPKLDLGDESSSSSSDILKYMKSKTVPFVAPDSACDSSSAADALMRAASTQLSANSEWLGSTGTTMLTSTPFVLFPFEQDQGERSQEVFIGLCDLPEMLSLACVPHCYRLVFREPMHPSFIYSPFESFVLGDVTCY